MASLKDLTDRLGNLFQSGANNVNSAIHNVQSHPFQIPSINLPKINMGNNFNPNPFPVQQRATPINIPQVASNFGRATAPIFNGQAAQQGGIAPFFANKYLTPIIRQQTGVPNLQTGIQQLAKGFTSDPNVDWTKLSPVAQFGQTVANALPLGGVASQLKDFNLARALKSGVVAAGVNAGANAAAGNKTTLQSNAIPFVAGSVIGGFGHVSPNEIEKGSQYILNNVDKPSVELIKNIVADLQTKGTKVSTENKLALESMAANIYGDKVRHFSDKQLANLMDATLKNLGSKPNDFNLGLVTQDIRSGAKLKPVAQAGLSDVSKLPNKKYVVRATGLDEIANVANGMDSGYHVSVLPKEKIGINKIHGRYSLLAEDTTGKEGPLFQLSDKENQSMIPNIKSQVVIPREKVKWKYVLDNETGKITPIENFRVAEQPLSEVKPPAITIGPSEKQRGFVTSVQESPNVNKNVKISTQGTYTPKANEQLMGEAKALLTDGASIDFKNVKNLDQKVAATIQEAINQDQKGNHEAAAALYNNLSAAGTEIGRGTQAFSLLNKMSPEAISLSAAAKIRKYNETATRKIPELTGEQQKMISDSVAQIRKMKEGRERNIAINELNQRINQFIPSSLVDKAITLWKAGLLTSLRTHERNLLGNAIMGGSEIIKDAPAAVVDRLMSLKTGQRSLAFNLQGQGSGTLKGIQAGKDIITRGYDPEATISKFDQKTITWGNNPLEQALKKGTDAVFRTLGAEDKPFLHGATARSLYDQAKVAAINAGKAGDQKFIEKLIKNPTPEMINTAAKEADYATFHDKTILSSIANSVKRAVDNPAYGKWGEFGKAVTNILAPFTGVPSSIVGKTIDYSPIGLAKGGVNVARVLAGQVPDLQRQAAQEIGRGIIGSGLFGLGAYLMSKGLMTGQPKDSKQADLWAAQNIPANSVKLFGKWRSINSIGPQNLVILAGAKYAEEMGKGDGSLANYGAALGKDQLNQTFLAGVQGPINAVTDPARYGQSYIGNQAASIVPNFVKDIAKSQDKFQRQNNSVQDYLTNSLPGLRNQNLVKRDVLGNPLKQEPTGLAAFVDLFNSKTPTNNPIANELARLDSTGNNATPAKLDKTQTVYGKKVTLTPKQIDQAVSSFSPQMQQQMIQMINSPEYQQLDDTQKADVLTNIASGAKNNDMLLNNIINGTTSTQPQGGVQLVNSQGIPTGTITKTSKLDKYQLQAAKDAFANGTDNFKDLGTVVLRKDAAGNVTAMTKDAFNTSLDEATLTNSKDNEDIGSWLSTADDLSKLYQRQLKDPNVDPLDKLQIQNKLLSLQKSIDKYKGYGGFKKGKGPKKIGSIKSVSIKAPKSFKLKLSKPPKVKIGKNTLKLTKSKSSTPAKFKVSKVNVRIGKPKLTG